MKLYVDTLYGKVYECIPTHSEAPDGYERVMLPDCSNRIAHHTQVFSDRASAVAFAIDSCSRNIRVFQDEMNDLETELAELRAKETP